jgi:hypothetical protein
MLNIGDFALILLALAGAVAVGAYWFSKTRLEPAGIVRANDFTDEKLRQAVQVACKGLDLAAMSREDAERHIEELARHAVGREYANIYPGQKIEVTPHWPDARCIISGNIAVIDLWVGRSFVGKGEGIRPIQVEVNRQPTLNLQTKRPIKAAWDDITAPPAKSEPVAPRLKVAAASSDAPKARKLPAKATLRKP